MTPCAVDGAQQLSGVGAGDLRSVTLPQTSELNEQASGGLTMDIFPGDKCVSLTRSA